MFSESLRRLQGEPRLLLLHQPHGTLRDLVRFSDPQSSTDTFPEVRHQAPGGTVEPKLMAEALLLVALVATQGKITSLYVKMGVGALGSELRSV